MDNPSRLQQMTPLVNRINRGGGFSVRAAGDELTPTGYLQYARNAYMVGVPGHGRDFPQGSITTSDLLSHIEANRGVLSRKDHFLGGWQGKDPTRGSVDVSRRFDRSKPGARSAAKVLAARGNQEAIGEVDEVGNYVGDIVNPNYDPKAAQTGKALSRADLDWAFPRPTGPREPSARRTTIPRR